MEPWPAVQTSELPNVVLHDEQRLPAIPGPPGRTVPSTVVSPSFCTRESGGERGSELGTH